MFKPKVHIPAAGVLIGMACSIYILWTRSG